MATRQNNPAPAEVTSPAAASDKTALPTVEFEAAMPNTRMAEAPAETAAPSSANDAIRVGAPIGSPRLAMSREPSRQSRFALLAASVAIAAAAGAVLGAGGTTAIMPAAAVTPAAGADDIRALKESIVRLSSELATVKASVESAAKSTSGQVAKLAERTDKAVERAVDKAVDKTLEKAVEKAAEKAQAEPSAKLARIAESLERLEKRPVPAALAAAPETTGSVPAAPADAARPGKPAVVEGWVVRDIFDGRALVESRFGTMLDVGPGSSIPGVGRVEAVRRQEGRWVVVTPKGLITSLR